MTFEPDWCMISGLRLQVQQDSDPMTLYELISRDSQSTRLQRTWLLQSVGVGDDCESVPLRVSERFDWESKTPPNHTNPFGIGSFSRVNQAALVLTHSHLFQCIALSETLPTLRTLYQHWKTPRLPVPRGTGRDCGEGARVDPFHLRTVQAATKTTTGTLPGARPTGEAGPMGQGCGTYWTHLAVNKDDPLWPRSL